MTATTRSNSRRSTALFAAEPNVLLIAVPEAWTVREFEASTYFDALEEISWQGQPEIGILSNCILRNQNSWPRDGGLIPLFLICAQKCGTTFLFRLLNCHPDVEPAVVKEVNYFSNFPEKGIDWYRSCFPAPAHREDGRAVWTWEASPNYLFYPGAARRAAEVAPGLKLIVLLRNPVDRAYSHYNHQVRRGNEPLSTFEEALEAEEERLRPAKERMRGEERLSVNFLRFSYVSRGLYAD